jgi:four helix bundle protein
MARRFENLKIFNLSYTFLLNVYSMLKLLPQEELRNIFSQLQRASTSIVLNIVEGASNKSNKVFFNHLQYSYGSCKESQVLLMLCKDLKYIDEKLFLKLLKELDDLTASIFKFMNSIEKEINVRNPSFPFYVGN